MAECLCCMANTGEKPISPGGALIDGVYWIAEHASPCSLLGWVVVRLKRHCEHLHELSQEEFRELAEFQYESIRLQNDLLNPEKEYIVCFSETPQFKHLHVHIIPKPKGTPPQKSGTGIFIHLKPETTEALKPEEIVAFSDEFRRRFRKEEDK